MQTQTYRLMLDTVERYVAFTRSMFAPENPSRADELTLDTLRRLYSVVGVAIRELERDLADQQVQRMSTAEGLARLAGVDDERH